jgi:hypothetical protein
MKEAYRLTRKDGAPGIDGVTATIYEANLEANLRDLLDRIKSGRYQAPPVRRAYILKADGTQRPLGSKRCSATLGASRQIRAGVWAPNARASVRQEISVASR